MLLIFIYIYMEWNVGTGVEASLYYETLVFGAHEDEDGTETNMLTYDPLGGVNIIYMTQSK